MQPAVAPYGCRAKSCRLLRCWESAGEIQRVDMARRWDFLREIQPCNSLKLWNIDCDGIKQPRNAGLTTEQEQSIKRLDDTVLIICSSKWGVGNKVHLRWQIEMVSASCIKPPWPQSSSWLIIDFPPLFNHSSNKWWCKIGASYECKYYPGASQNVRSALWLKQKARLVLVQNDLQV